MSPVDEVPSLGRALAVISLIIQLHGGETPSSKGAEIINDEANGADLIKNELIPVWS